MSLVNVVAPYLLVFLGMVLTDVCWVRYTVALQAHNRLIASCWSAAIVACGAVVVVSYTENHALAWAAIAGAFVGTYFAMEKK